jgi:hypothetical protein
MLLTPDRQTRFGDAYLLEPADDPDRQLASTPLASIETIETKSLLIEIRLKN